MDATSVVGSFNVLPEPFPVHFSEEEMALILKAVKETINSKFSKDEDVPKTILLDLFGLPKTMKTTVTPRIEQVAKRSGLKAFCPPETAEVEEVRDKLRSDPLLSQAIHLNGVEAYVLNCAYHPRMHLVILSRGLIDMLYWYEADRRKGTYTDEFCGVMSRAIYELLKKDLVDSFIFCTCSVEAAMKREYEGSLTQERGSKMNEKNIAEALDIYKTVLEGVNKNVPNLPIFHVDTSDMDVKEMGMEIMRFVLPTICRRFSIPVSNFMPYSPTLLEKQAKLSANFEEQFKFRGHPSRKKLERFGWRFEGTLEQEDIYLNSTPGVGDSDGVFDKIQRIRKDSRGLKFMYKGPAEDRWLSHRRPLTFDIDPQGAEKRCKLYPVILTLKKVRACYELNQDNALFTVHVDTIEGLGNFTEIRALGSSDCDHSKELMDLATQLGFNFSDVVEGSYLALALKNK